MNNNPENDLELEASDSSMGFRRSATLSSRSASSAPAKTEEPKTALHRRIDARPFDTLYSIYVAESDKVDLPMAARWKEDMDGILIYVGNTNLG